MIDHRNADGLSNDEAQKTGAMPVGAGTMFEAPIATCSHCQRGIVMNPLRTRDRAYCPGCDRYICDECALVRKLSGVCKTFKQVMDDEAERALRSTPAGVK